MIQIFPTSETALQYFVRITGKIGQTKILPFKRVRHGLDWILTARNHISFNFFVCIMLFMTPFYGYRFSTLSQRERENIFGIILMAVFAMGFSLASVAGITLSWKKIEIAWIVGQMIKLYDSGN